MLIFHVDVNSAFLSWTAVKQLKEHPDGPDLRKIPSVVGGDPETRHGIVTAKSIPAKRFGIETAEPIASAMRKCPNLVVVPSDFETYREYSHAFLAILRKYAPVVEQASIDEAYLDMTDAYDALQKVPAFVALEQSGVPYPQSAAQLIKDEIRDTLGFTVNVGISTNKLLAKMASDFTKPDRIHTLYPAEVPEKMWPLPVQDLFGCGKKTAERLKSVGILTIGDAAGTSLDWLQSLLGEKGGTYIHEAANGISHSVVSAQREEAKSYSNETTTPQDITIENYDVMFPPIVKELSESVSRRMKRDGVYAKTCTIMVKTDEFQKRSMQMAMPEITNEEKIIYDTAMLLADKLLLGEHGLFTRIHGIRLVGVKASDLDNGEYHQMSLFEALQEQENYLEGKRVEKKKRERDERLNAMTKQIQGKFGNGAIKKGL